MTSRSASVAFVVAAFVSAFRHVPNSPGLPPVIDAASCRSACPRGTRNARVALVTLRWLHVLFLASLLFVHFAALHGLPVLFVVDSPAQNFDAKMSWKKC